MSHSPLPAPGNIFSVCVCVQLVWDYYFFFLQASWTGGRWGRFRWKNLVSGATLIGIAVIDSWPAFFLHCSVTSLSAREQESKSEKKKYIGYCWLRFMWSSVKLIECYWGNVFSAPYLRRSKLFDCSLRSSKSNVMWLIKDCRALPKIRSRLLYHIFH